MAKEYREAEDYWDLMEGQELSRKRKKEVHVPDKNKGKELYMCKTFGKQTTVLCRRGKKKNRSRRSGKKMKQQSVSYAFKKYNEKKETEGPEAREFLWVVQDTREYVGMRGEELSKRKRCN